MQSSLLARRSAAAAAPSRSRNVTTKAQQSVSSSGGLLSKAAAAAAAAAAAGVLLAGAPAFAASAAGGNGVSFANAANGATLASPAHLEFAVKGLEVRPAAEGLQKGSGHFHLLIDADKPDEGDVIPFDAKHLHYGKGQQQADVELAAGKHVLTLQFANALHESLGPAWARTITVNVK